MPLVQDERGNVYEQLDRGMLRPMTREEVDSLGKNPLESFGESVGLSAISAVKGAQTLLGDEQAAKDLAIARRLQAGNERVNPVSSFAGQAVPGALVAAGTAGMGVPAVMGTEALLGAAYMPENPFLGAGIGAAIPGAFAAAPVVGRVLGQMGREGLGAFPVPGIPMTQAAAGRMTGQGGRMSDRVMQNIDAAAPDAPRGRVLEGHLTADELDAMGVPLLPSQRIKLTAEVPEQYQMGQKAAWAEGIRGGTEDVLQAQRMALTNAVKNEAGIVGPQALTGTVIGDRFAEAGRIIGDFRKANGPIQLGADQLERIGAVADNALSGASADFKRVISDIEKSMAKTGGAIDPQDANTIMSRLGNMSKPGGEYGTITGAKEILDEFNIALNMNRSEAERIAYAQAMKEYRLLKTLNKTGVVGKDGLVNAQSFSTHWKKQSSQTGQGRDRIGQLANTFATLGYKDVHTGNTLQRVFAEAPGRVAQAAPGAALTAAGLGGLNFLVGG